MKELDRDVQRVSKGVKEKKRKKFQDKQKKNE